MVEDNRDVADMVALALELDGHDVHVAYDGAEGLREAARIRPDAAVLDIGLPKMDGIELAHALRHMHGDSVMLIACTGMSEGPVGARVAKAGFDHVFVKPVPIDRLLDAVDRPSRNIARRAPPPRAAAIDRRGHDAARQTAR